MTSAPPHILFYLIFLYTFTLPENASMLASTQATAFLVSWLWKIKYFSLHCNVKSWPPLWTHTMWTHTTWRCFHTSNSFSAYWFLRRFWKIFLYIFLCNIPILPLPCGPIVPPRDHDLNKLESTQPDDASTQVTAFLNN